MAGISKKRVLRSYCAIEDGIMCGLRSHIEDGILKKVEPGGFPQDPGLEH
ncbi:hypothetical protein ACFL9T_18135 [Thermodesulfobacteriota bacterium]